MFHAIIITNHINKYDYIRLQNDLEKKESLNQQIDPLVKQLEEIEKEISDIRSKLHQK